jgi:hypothetical protein
MQDFRRDGGVDAHTAEGDAPRPGSVVDVRIVPDIASNAAKPVVLNPICVRSARTGAARREARRRGAPSPVEPSAARQPTGVAAGVPSFFLRDGERGKRADTPTNVTYPKGQRVTVVSLSHVFSNHSNSMEQPGLDDLADHSSMPEVRICSGGMVRSLSHTASLD